MDCQDLDVFTDADFPRDPNDRRSISGGVIVSGGAALSWLWRAKTRVATSSTEAEYVALSDTVKEAEFDRGILEFLEQHRKRGIIAHENNHGAMQLATNPLSSARSRYIDVRYHYA